MRTPNEIKEHAIMCFRQMAPAKYDKGQQKAQTNLDEHPDLVGAIREELVDGWFYLHSLAQQIEINDSYIAELELELDRSRDEVKKLKESVDGLLLEAQAQRLDLLLEAQRLEGDG
tara:strand:+ start:375 stop:722 length:348 start_codon:yes stop_codon:yes gene_type:complete